MKLIIQPTNDSCTSACLAMILRECGHDIDVDTVIGEFHEAFRNDLVTPASYLRGKKVKVRELNSLQRMDRFGSIYLLCVPSLNVEAEFHSIVVDARDVIEIFDPRNDGVHRYYTYDNNSDDPLAVKLSGHIVDVEIFI